MVKSLDEVIERLQYKADNIKAKLEPSYFTECIDYLKTLPTCKDCAGCTDWVCECANIKQYAIDEFAEKIIELDAEFPTVEDEFGEYRPMTIKEMCSVIAEQMKGE